MDINNVIKNNDLGKEFYNWLINPLDKVKLIDFEDISKNDFAVVDELPYCVVEGTESGSFRPYPDQWNAAVIFRGKET